MELLNYPKGSRKRKGKGKREPIGKVNSSALIQKRVHNQGQRCGENLSQTTLFHFQEIANNNNRKKGK